MRPARFAGLLASTLLLVLPAFSAQSADGRETKASSPPTAKSLADRVDHHYNTLHSLSVNFTQEYDGMGTHRRESGLLILRKPGKMRWTYSQPEGKLFLLDGHDAYFYSPGSNEVPRIPAGKLDDFRSPLRFLLGHTNLARDFTNLQLTPASDGNYDLSGIPKGMEQRITSLRLHVSAEGVILGMKIDETDGALTSFVFADEKTNIPTKDADFVFRPAPGVKVIDGLPPI